MHPMFTDIGSYLKAVPGAVPVSLTSVAVNGAAAQLEGIGYSYKSAVIVLSLGAATGSPTGISVVAKVQQSADGSTSWTDFTDLYSHGAVTGIAASTLYTANVVLQGAQQFVRVVTTPTLTGGSSPTVLGSSFLILGGSSEFPAV